MFSLITFGTLAITTRDGKPTTLASRRRALALLALAAASPNEGVSRDRAMALLWPELDTASARNNLKQTVFGIRRALEVEVFDRTSPNIRLEPREITVDLHRFERALAAGAHEDAVSEYTGPFLDGFFVPDLVEFERWVERVRQRLDLGYVRALETLAVRARLRGEASAATHWYRALVEHDPVSTSSVLGLMLSLAAVGELLEALRYYEQHAKLLLEFDAKPNSKIELAAEYIRHDLKVRAGGSMPVIPAAARGDGAGVPTQFSDSTRRTSGPIRPLGRKSGPTAFPPKNSGPSTLPTNPSRPNG